MRVFFFHYNKPATQRAGTPKMSVHWRGACHIVDNVVCNVPSQSKQRKRQPRVVMAGKAESMTVRDGIAYIE